MLTVVGTNHKRASLSVREKIFAAFSLLSKEGVLLSTCNRIEYYFYSEDCAVQQEEIIRFLRKEGGDGEYLYTFFGQECVHHLGRVVCGLDSLFCLETEIQGQVKRAYELARKKASLPKPLHILFQRALHIGKIMRRAFSPPQENLSDCVVDAVSSYLVHRGQNTALLIGASSINLQIAQRLQKEKIVVTCANRTKTSAEKFAKKIGAATLSWNLIQNTHCHFPCIISATRSPEYLITEKQTFSRPQLFIDLGVPRNIDPSISSSLTEVMNIEAFLPISHSTSILQLERMVSRRSKQEFFSLSNKCQTR